MKTRGFFGIILALALVICFTLAAGASSYSGTPNTKWYNTTATEFSISTAEQLAGLAKLVNAGNEFSGKTIKLTADIVWFDGTINEDGTYSGGTPKEWPVIAAQSNGFSGTFDGQGHTIKGLYNNNITSDYFVGLFGNTYSSSVVKNVGVIDSYFANNSVSGSIVAKTYGSIISCYSNAFLCTRTGVSGGICGNTKCDSGKYIKNCYFNGKIIPYGKSGYTAASIGGIVGLVSSNAPSVQNCIYRFYCSQDSKGVAQNGIGSPNVGTFSADVAGRTRGLTADDIANGRLCYLLNGSSSENPVWYQDIDNGKTDAMPSLLSTHGIVYYGYKDCSSTEKTYSNTPLFDSVGNHNYSNGVCTICKSNEEPKTENGIYQIDNFGKLLWFGNYVNTVSADVSAQLCHEIDMENSPLNSVIGTVGKPFTGSFDGKGYTIKNFYYKPTASYSGLFGSVSGGKIFNFTLNGKALIDSSVNHVGFLAGNAKGGAEISNITVNANITGSASVQHIGGIVGSSQDIDGILTIEKCIFNGKIDLPSASDCAGGILGYSNDFVTISNCAMTGSISCPLTFTGGILGYINNEEFGGLTGCYSTAEVKGSTGNTGAIIGRLRNVGASDKVKNNVCKDGTVAYGGEKGTNYPSHKVSDWKTGEAAYFLNGGVSDSTSVWLQKLGENPDTMPSFVGSIVYRVGQKKFANAEQLCVYIQDGKVTTRKTVNPCTLVVASYKENALVDVKIVPITSAVSKTYAEIGLVTQDTDKVVAYLWGDTAKLIPLCEEAQA